MSVELTPKGVACNLSCTYCYQHPMRDAGNIGNEKDYDMDKMFAALTEEGGDFLVFGGEPLLVPIEDLRTIFAWGWERYKKNGIQTNGVLITTEHIAMFKEFNVHVGFSMDGPDELNDSRWAGTLERTRESTVKSHANMKACIAAGVATSLIITLYKGNATPERLPRLKQWIRELDTMGSRGVRIHLLEIDHPLVKAKMQLTEKQVIAALLELVALEATLPKHPFRHTNRHAPNLLRADDDNVTCIWNPCDPYTTSAVRGVDGQGNKSNCGRTNKDGIPRLKAEQQGYERQLALQHATVGDGGCKDCRFFLMCKGQCPGTAIDGDWRNRTARLQDLDDSVRDTGTGNAGCGREAAVPQLRRACDIGAGDAPVCGSAGRHVSLRFALAHVRAGKPVIGSPFNVDHGDIPHGDQHGDHWDHQDGAQHQDEGSLCSRPRTWRLTWRLQRGDEMRLPFVLADFTRIIWHSEDARAVWAPRIAKINQVWGEIERQAVVEGVRDACLTFVDPQNLPEVSLWAAVRGLVVLPLATNGVASQYSSTSTAVVAGRPFQYRIVLTRPEFAERWAKAWAGELDNKAVGEMLGYPACCREFFEQVWVKDKGVDTSVGAGYRDAAG
jgi:uncharacterized protein